MTTKNSAPNYPREFSVNSSDMKTRCSKCLEDKPNSLLESVDGAYVCQSCRKNREYTS